MVFKDRNGLNFKFNLPITYGFAALYSALSSTASADNVQCIFSSPFFSRTGHCESDLLCLFVLRVVQFWKKKPTVFRKKHTATLCHALARGTRFKEPAYVYMQIQYTR